MCLDVIDKKTKQGKGYGYKGFCKVGGKLRGVCKCTFAFPEEVWFTDPNTELIAGRYAAGFHINKFKKHARTWGGHTTRKVFYKDVVASGYWFKEPVIVARQIWITKEEI